VRKNTGSQEVRKSGRAEKSRREEEKKRNQGSGGGGHWSIVSGQWSMVKKSV